MTPAQLVQHTAKYNTQSDQITDNHPAFVTQRMLLQKLKHINANRQFPTLPKFNNHQMEKFVFDMDIEIDSSMYNTVNTQEYDDFLNAFLESTCKVIIQMRINFPTLAFDVILNRISQHTQLKF